MNLKIACLKPNRCSFDCLNCPYGLGYKHFKDLYEIESLNLKDYDNNKK